MKTGSNFVDTKSGFCTIAIKIHLNSGITLSQVPATVVVSVSVH